MLVEGSSPTLQRGRRRADARARRAAGRAGASARATRRTALVVAGTPASSPLVASLDLRADLETLGAEGYVLRSATSAARPAGARDRRQHATSGVLYGAFALAAARSQTGQPLDRLALASGAAPAAAACSTTGTTSTAPSSAATPAARSGTGTSCPTTIDPRYTDYARANASIGINGTVLNNVNANAPDPDAEYLAQGGGARRRRSGPTASASISRRASARRSRSAASPTADPLDPAVRRVVARQGRRDLRADPRLRRLPGQGQLRGPAGAAGLRPHATPTAPTCSPTRSRPHGGIVMWRAFVYSSDVPDGPRQAGVRRVQAARRQVPRQRDACRSRTGRSTSSRASRSTRCSARCRSTPLDAGAADHQGVSRLRHAPRLPRRRCSRRCSAPTRTRRARARPSRRSIDGSAATATRSPASPASPTSAPTATGAARTSTRPTGTRSAASPGIPTLVARDIADEWMRQTFTQRRRRSSRRSSSMMMRLARGGGGLHDAAGPAPHDGARPPLRPRAVGRTAGRAPTGPRSTTTAPTRTASASTARASGSNAVAQYFPPVRARFGDLDDACREDCCSGSTTCRGTTACRRAGRCGTSCSHRYSARRRRRARDAGDVGRRSRRASTPSATTRCAGVPGDPGAGGALVARRLRRSISRPSRSRPIPPRLREAGARPRVLHEARPPLRSGHLTTG